MDDPGARVKTGVDILIPLSGAAQDLLASIPHISPHIFTTRGTGGFGNFSQLKRELDELSGVKGWRLHDLRRTSRTLLSRAGVAPDVSERCLGHVVTGIGEFMTGTRLRRKNDWHSRSSPH